MNFELPFIPERPTKPRNSGLTMMMDKGLSLRETENFIEANKEITDIVKFGFGTAYVTNNLEEKIALYRQNGIRPYFGGTLFEAFYARNKFEDYLRLIDKYQLDLVEISDGSIIVFQSTMDSAKMAALFSSPVFCDQTTGRRLVAAAASSGGVNAG